MFQRAAKSYISLAFLWILLQNATIAGAIALILAYNQSGGHPNWNLLFIIFVAAFLKSIFDHAAGAKWITLLQLIWAALQQLNQQQNPPGPPTTYKRPGEMMNY